jgi:hypothetical protein
MWNTCTTGRNRKHLCILSHSLLFFPRRTRNGDYFHTSLTLTLDGGGKLTPGPGRFIPGKETRYPFGRRLGGPQGGSGPVRKISLLPKFDPRSDPPVASRYTDWAVPAYSVGKLKKSLLMDRSELNRPNHRNFHVQIFLFYQEGKMGKQA